MDYKELIRELNEWNENYISELCSDDVFECDVLCECRHEDCIVVQAATAIETLLAERDKAVEHVQKNCNTCRWWHDGGCCAPLELYGGCDFLVRQAWEWRGAQNPFRAD